METKSRQTSLSPENEKILKNGASTIERGDKLACQRSEDSATAEPEVSPSKNEGWFGIQTLLDRSGLENPDSVIDHFLEQVDDSNYSLTDWLEALLEFDKWLEAQKIDARPVETMIGYIHCSTMGAPQTLAAPELSRVVLENLEEWGFDAVKPIALD